MELIEMILSKENLNRACKKAVSKLRLQTRQKLS